MSSARLTYEIHPDTKFDGRFQILALRGTDLVGPIATGLKRNDAVAFKQLKEIQGQAASIRNRRANRKQRVAAGGGEVSTPLHHHWI